MNLVRNIASLGGTFDTFHNGHKDYIRLGFKYAKQVRIYITTDDFAKSIKNYPPKPFLTRKKYIENYVRTLGCESQTEILSLAGIEQLKESLVRKELSIAIIVPEYYDYFRNINAERRENGINCLELVVKERTYDSIAGDISSTRLRQVLQSQVSLVQNITKKVPIVSSAR